MRAIPSKSFQDTEERMKEYNEFQEDEFANFAYIIAHDLKSPLRAIQILTEWIVRDNGDRLTESGQEHLALLQDRVKRMDLIIDGVSQYSRIGREIIEPESVDLNQMVDYIIAVMAIPEHITCRRRKTLPVIQCKRDHVKMVFQHLIENAVKFMDKSAGKVEIDVSEGIHFWEFSISDNGPGIDEKYQTQIFEIFQTLYSKDDKNGCGIGLTLSKKIVETAGGRLWLESQKGAGSTFLFTLPKNEA